MQAMHVRLKFRHNADTKTIIINPLKKKSIEEALCNAA